MELHRRCHGRIQNGGQLLPQLLGLDRTLQGEEMDLGCDTVFFLWVMFLISLSEVLLLEAPLSLRWASSITRTTWATCGPSRRRLISFDRSTR